MVPAPGCAGGYGRATSNAKKSQRKAAARAEKNIAKASTKDSLQALSKLTEVVDGHHRIISAPPVVIPARDLAHMYGFRPPSQGGAAGKPALLPQHPAPRSRRLLERFEFVDFARKVVGVGSAGNQGMDRLVQGRDGDDPLFLQAKEATASVLEDHLPKSRFRQPGERVVQGQRLMQAASDIFLGWTKGAQEDVTTTGASSATRRDRH